MQIFAQNNSVGSHPSLLRGSDEDDTTTLFIFLTPIMLCFERVMKEKEEEG